MSEPENKRSKLELEISSPSPKEQVNKTDGGQDALKDAGTQPTRADLIADVLVCADERGIRSHGVNRLALYCDEVRRRIVNADGNPSIASDLPAAVLVDGDNAQGAVVAAFCTKLAIARARTHGVGWVVSRRSNHYGIAGYWSKLAADEGMLGLSFTNTSPVVVPFNGAKGALGTNPIACAAPSKGDEHVEIDMATSTVPLGRIEVARRTETACKQGWGVDADGRPTTHPDDILQGGALCPLGTSDGAGHKGFCLSLLVDILCGVAAGARFGPQLGQGMNPQAVHRQEELNLGQCFVAVDVENLQPGFAERMHTYAMLLRQQPGQEGVAVMVPGDPEHRTADGCKRQGIALPGQLYTALGELAALSGVELNIKM